MAEEVWAKFTGEYYQPTTKDQDGNDVPTGERIPAVYLNGIPARDLTAEDRDALTPEQRKAVEQSDLYDVASRRRAAARDKKEGD